MDVNTEAIKTSTVMERYGINSRTTLNDWLSKAGVQSFRQGKETYIHAYQLDALDALAFKLGRPINYTAGVSPEFIEPVKLESESSRVSLYKPDIEVTTLDLIAIARDFEELPKLARWLAGYIILEQIALQRAIVPREILLLVLGYKRMPPSKNGRVSYGNFSFYPVDKAKKQWGVNKEL